MNGINPPRISLRQPGSLSSSDSISGIRPIGLPKRLVSVVVISAFLLSIISLYFLGIPFPIPKLLGSGSSDPPYVEPHLLHTDLGLEITAISSDPPTVRATITNYHPETTINLLTWDTPLDDLAPTLGLFTFKEASASGTPSFGFQRIEPERPAEPPEDAFYELLPFHAVTKDIVLPDPRSMNGHTHALPPGLDTEIEVKGLWQAFWHANVTKLGSERLKKMGGGFGYYRGEFRASCMMHVDGQLQ